MIYFTLEIYVYIYFVFHLYEWIPWKIIEVLYLWIYISIANENICAKRSIHGI